MFQLFKGWLNTFVSKKAKDVLVKLLVSQLLTGWLNALAALNIAVILVTPLMSQLSTTPQILLNYLDAYRNFRDVKKSCVNPVVSGFDAQTARVGVWGSGCSYDSVGQAGINANGSTLGFELKSNLDDPLNRGTQTPYAVYTFYLCKNQVQVDTGGNVNVGM